MAQAQSQHNSRLHRTANLLIETPPQNPRYIKSSKTSLLGEKLSSISHTTLTSSCCQPCNATLHLEPVIQCHVEEVIHVILLYYLLETSYSDLAYIITSSPFS
ncbi:hypothetical protein COP2_016502 [Malus domestica]